jgi:hypothetical protein
VDWANETENPQLALVAANGLLVARYADLLTEVYGAHGAVEKMRTIGIGVEINDMFNPDRQPDPDGEDG